MERTEVLDLMGQLRLFGMKNAYDEILATGPDRSHRLASKDARVSIRYTSNVR